MQHPLRFFCALMFILTMNAHAQTPSTPPTHSKRELQKSPIWIDLMNDPNANYFETIRAFREFWKDRVLPKEPFETGVDQFEMEVGLIDESERASAKAMAREEREEKERAANPKKHDESMLYAAQVRAFKGWMQDVKPWVRTDGSIISPAERQAIIDQQSKELKAIENTQKK
jgi:hypothetical protein